MIHRKGIYKMKRWIALCMVVFCLAFAGCSGNGGTSSQNTNDIDKSNANASEAAQKLVDEINQKITTKSEKGGFKLVNQSDEDGMKHEVFEDEGIATSLAMSGTPDPSAQTLKTTMDVVSMNGEIKKITLNAEKNEKMEYSYGYSSAMLAIGEKFSNFQMEGSEDTMTYTAPE